jgi:hypothetical protein
MPAIVSDSTVQYPISRLGACNTGLMGHSGKKEFFCGTRTKNKCLVAVNVIQFTGDKYVTKYMSHKGRRPLFQTLLAYFPSLNGSEIRLAISTDVGLYACD